MKSDINTLTTTSLFFFDTMPASSEPDALDDPTSFTTMIGLLEAAALRGFEPRAVNSQWTPCASTVAFIAHAIRTRGIAVLQWTPNYTSSELANLALHADAGSWPWVDVVLSLALSDLASTPPEVTASLGMRTLTLPRQLPTPLEWRRTLAVARTHWRNLRPSLARRLVSRAITQAALLARPDSGPCGDDAARSAASLISRQPMSAITHTLAPRAIPLLPCASPSPPVVTQYPEWDTLTAIVRHSKAMFVHSASPRELDVFLTRLFPDSTCAWVRPPSIPPTLTARVVVVSPIDEFSHETARRLAVLCRDARRHGGSVILGSLTSRDTLRAQGYPWTALIESAEGPAVALPHIGQTPTSRVAALRALARDRFGLDAHIPPHLLDAAAAYSWPGGLAEIEALVSDLVIDRQLRADLDLRVRAYWLRALSAHPPSHVSPVVRSVADVVSNTPGSSSPDCARRAGLPPRSCQRALAQAIAAGLILRTGQGRATRYFPVARPAIP